LLLLRNPNGQMGAIVLVKSTTAVNDQDQPAGARA